MLQIGPYEGRHFAHTEIYEPADQRHAEYGRIFFVFEATVHPELGAELQSIILNTVKEQYYSDLTRDPYESLEHALQAVNDKLGNLAVKGVTDWVGKMNAIIAVLSDTSLHLTQTGAATLLLIRGETATNISAGLSPNANELTGDKAFFNISTGTLLQGDYLLFVTNANYDDIADRDLVHTLRTVQFTDRTSLSQKLGGLNVHGTPVDILIVRVGSSARTFGLDLDTAAEPMQAMGSSSEGALIPTGALGKYLKQLLRAVQNLIAKVSGKPAGAPPADIEGEMYGTSGMTPGKSKFSNTFQLLKDNSFKGIERLFSKKHTGLLTARTQRKRLLTWIIVIIVIIVGTYWLIQIRKSSVAHQEMVQTLADIRDSKGVARTRSIYEPDSAKNLIIGLERKAQGIIDETSDPELKAEAEQELKDLNDLLDKVDKVYRIPTPTVAYDLSVERPDIHAMGLLGLGGQLYAFDHNALYKLVLDNIDTRKVVVGQDENLEVVDADGFGQEQEVVLLTKDKGVIEFKDNTFAYGVTQDQQWHPGVAITDYDNSRLIYVLDPASKEIWKYPRSRSGFDAPSRKNVAGTDISQAIDFAIDGAIYLLMQDGTVTKFFDDKLATFEFTGLVKPLNNPIKIIADTDVDAGFLYILDTGNNRIVVTGKGGEYIAQYVFENAEHLVDMYIDEEADQIYALEQNGKVYQTEIKHYAN